MDIRDILKSFDNLSEATTTNDKGTVHKADPGGYGNKHGTDDVTDQYGKPVGRVSLGKLGAQNEPKRGKGRPPNPDKAKEYDSTALNKAMGIGKPPKPTGKPSVKHSLKEYFDQLDDALSEADAYTTSPMTGAVAVKDATGKVVATAKNPQAAAAFQKGDITLGSGGMTEDQPNGSVPDTARIKTGLDNLRGGMNLPGGQTLDTTKLSSTLAGNKLGQTFDTVSQREIQKLLPGITAALSIPNTAGLIRQAIVSAQKQQAQPTQSRPNTDQNKLDEISPQLATDVAARRYTQADQLAWGKNFPDAYHNDPRVAAYQNKGTAAANYAQKRGATDKMFGAALDKVQAGPAVPMKNIANPQDINWVKDSVHIDAITDLASAQKEIADYAKHHQVDQATQKGMLDAAMAALKAKGVAESGDIGKHNNAKTLSKMHESYGMMEAGSGALDWKSMINANASVGELRDMFEKYNLPRSIADFLEYAKDARNLGQAMQYFDKKSLEDEDYGRRVDREYGGNVSSGYYQLQDLMSEQMEEAEAPQHFAQSSPLSTANRGVLESKKGVNPFAKKDDKTAKKDDKAEKIGKEVTKDIEKKGAAPKKGVNPFAKKAVKEGAKPDFNDVDDDGDEIESWTKAEKDKKAKAKQKVKEGMEHHLQAARLEGKSHALRKMPYNCTHDDMEEARCYHDGFKEGLDECYGQMPILGRTAVDEMGSEVGTMASYGAVDEGMGDDIQYGQYCSARDEGKTHEQAVAQIAQRYGRTPKNVEYALNGYPEYTPGIFHGRRDHGAGPEVKPSLGSRIKSAFGMGEGELDELAFEALDKQLNAILEGKEVSEGMTVSISKGQQGAPDSVSVSAQDGEADQLLSIIKSAGMGLFGGEDKGFSAPEGGTGAHGGISVVDDHDGMMSLMKKLSGGGEVSGGDYESEEGHEGHGEEGHSHEGEEDTCNECGMAYESCGCDHDEPVVDEEESRDQMAYNVAEEDEDTTGEEAGKEDEEKVEEGIYESYANSADDTFEADIEFMTNVITGGLNKRKATGETTIPVIAGQKDRMGADGLGSPMKESTDLLKDFRKLSGL